MPTAARRSMLISLKTGYKVRRRIVQGENHFYSSEFNFLKLCRTFITYKFCAYVRLCRTGPTHFCNGVLQLVFFTLASAAILLGHTDGIAPTYNPITMLLAS
jgi:hypothetical protein